MSAQNRTAAAFGCTKAQATAQMRKNLAQLRAMRDKARASGRRINGYDAAELSEMILKVCKGWNL